MFGGALTVVLDDGFGKKKLTRLRGKFANWVPVMEGKLAPFLRDAIAEQFQTEGQFFGTKWDDIVKATRDWRASHGHDPGNPILQASGSLYDSFVNPDDENTDTVFTDRGLKIISKVPWGQYHTSPEPRTGPLPRRVIVPEESEMPESFLKQLRAIVTGFFVEVEFS